MVVFPYQVQDGRFGLALADPTDIAAIRAAEIVLGGPLEIEVASFEDIATVLAERLGETTASHRAPARSRPMPMPTMTSRACATWRAARRSCAPSTTCSRKPIELRATDIHIEPFRTGLVVRMRVDGLLRAVPTPAGALPQALISRIKILAGLNIAERRLPQDGAARLRIARTDIDVRVATMPTQHGESAVIRLLPRIAACSRSASSASRADEASSHGCLTLPHGMIVVTGPTGSGKTTTLATMLSILNESTRKILTIEDPVEYEIHGVNQSQVKPSIGLTFATALRAFVRQDPDVIMVGEMRDAETAHIAIHAALTGHLVLTTLHTETAAAAMPRLLDLGVEGFLLKSTLRAVIAQRLVRILCDRCKTERAADSGRSRRRPALRRARLRAAATVVHEPVGCERCGGTGYRGRVGVFEVLETDRGGAQPDRSAHRFRIDRARRGAARA